MTATCDQLSLWGHAVIADVILYRINIDLLMLSIKLFFVRDQIMRRNDRQFDTVDDMQLSGGKICRKRNCSRTIFTRDHTCIRSTDIDFLPMVIECDLFAIPFSVFEAPRSVRDIGHDLVNDLRESRVRYIDIDIVQWSHRAVYLCCESA